MASARVSSDVSLLSQSFWTGPRDMAMEESWLGVGVSAGRRG